MSSPSSQPLRRFILGVTLYLPLTFALWYVSAGLHLAPITWLAGQLLNMLVPDALLWLKLDGHYLVMAANFGHDVAGLVVSPPPTNADVLGFRFNPLIYSYSLPLLAALTLATPSQQRWQRLAWGAGLLLPTELFSMVFSILKMLTFGVGTAFQTQQGLTQFGVDAIALGYQTGTLLIPMIAPLIIWMALHRDFLQQLAPVLPPIQTS